MLNASAEPEPENCLTREEFLAFRKEMLNYRSNRGDLLERNILTLSVAILGVAVAAGKSGQIHFGALSLIGIFSFLISVFLVLLCYLITEYRSGEYISSLDAAYLRGEDIPPTQRIRPYWITISSALFFAVGLFILSLSLSYEGIYGPASSPNTTTSSAQTSS